MPSYIRLAVDIRDLDRDLEALGDGLNKPIRDTLSHGATAIAEAARPLMRHGQPSWLSSSAARDFPGEIADYYDARSAELSATVGSTHPAAPVWEWGGEIHPASGGDIGRSLHAAVLRRHALGIGHEQVITIPGLHPVGDAGDSKAADIEQELEDAVDELIREYGF